MLNNPKEDDRIGITSRRSRFQPDSHTSPSAAVMQTKLAINKPGDRYEQEAGQTAGQVMRTPGPKLQRLQTSRVHAQQRRNRRVQIRLFR